MKNPVIKLFLITFLSIWLGVPLAARASEGKVVVIDFEDVGSWRVRENAKKLPGTNFGHNYLDGSKNEKFHGDYVGELRFAFDPAAQGPFHLACLRQKMTLVKGFLNGVEFYANPKGLRGIKLRFAFSDQSGQQFISEPIALDPKAWQKYVFPLNGQTVPNWQKAKQPTALSKIIMQADEPCSGSIYLDDVTLCGDFARANLLSIYPIYEGISYRPDEDVSLKYRIRNASDDEKDVTVTLAATSLWKEEVAPLKKTVEVPAYGEKVVEFKLGKLPIGSYFAKVTAEAGASVAYDDYFGVFIPNDRRVNRKPMLFGVQDQSDRQGRSETELHLDWMKKLGIDINRFDINANGFRPQYEISKEFYSWLIKSFAKNGIDVLPVHWETPEPLFNKALKEPWRQPPTDYAAYQQYEAEFGKFISQYPNVKYVEYWNEPDVEFYLGDLDSFVKMSEAFYKGVKATAPNVKLTSGSSTVRHPREKKGFSLGMYDRCKDFYDIAAFHAHGPLQNYEERQASVDQWMKQAGVNKPVCNTESGERSIYTFDGSLDQAQTLVKKIVYAKSRPNTELYIWFTLQDYWDMDAAADDSFGLVTSDNRAKPSFVAYNELIRQLANSDPVDSELSVDDVRSFKFSGVGKKTYAVWTKTGQANALLWVKSSSPISQVDMFGRKMELKGLNGIYPVNITKAPSYLSSRSDIVAAGNDEKLVQAPSQLLVKDERGIVFPIRIGKQLVGKMEAILRDSKGNILWKDNVELSGGEEGRELMVPLIYRQIKDLSDRRLELSFILNSNAASALNFPMSLVDAYTIRKVPPLASPLDYKSVVGGASKIILKNKKEITELSYDPFIAAWSGEDDLSVSASMVQDGKGIYFYFDVKDNKHVPSARPQAPWEGDDVQIAIAKEGDTNCTQFDIALQASGKTFVLCNNSPNPSLNGEWNIPAKVERKDNHTIYECYVPYEKLGLSYSSGVPVRATFLVNENDGQGRVRWISWHDGIGRGRDVNLFGHTVLE